MLTSKKKRVKTKAQAKAKKERQRCAAAIMFLTSIWIIIIFSVYFTLNQSNNNTINQEFSLRAAIIDHLSLTTPNQTFIQTAATILKQAGYTVDYYPGKKVTVEFFQNLPSHGYKIIILRVHSSATNPDGTEGPVTLFTSERYDSTKYVYEQLSSQLVRVAFSLREREKGITYFGINPPFITQSMKNTFSNTIIIVMGCESLTNPLMAKAFVEKGAKAYIGWNKMVLSSHTDLATACLLHHLLIENQTLKHSVQETFKKVGFDPKYESLLLYYPLEVGNEKVEGIARTSIAKPLLTHARAN